MPKQSCLCLLSLISRHQATRLKCRSKKGSELESLAATPYRAPRKRHPLISVVPWKQGLLIRRAKETRYHPSPDTTSDASEEAVQVFLAPVCDPERLHSRAPTAAGDQGVSHHRLVLPRLPAARQQRNF
ncbi:hypothetical protein CC86DRAFT_194931 [Ophiobolus disseminans]|uniref:Uncharacterized protein n=1 Tax=Ophiobolus disseminans TaxID=1469910 RepID=A0A6A7A5J0_9PLEO|nr:hypothetical protein CC86DRAFT_194931 [Ophiobolus disseminans]